MLESLTCDSFAKHLQQSFEIEAGSQNLALELIEAKALGAGAEGERQSFSLLFRGPAEPLLEQQIYKMSHAEMGALELFEVPVGQEEAGTLYEVVFT